MTICIGTSGWSYQHWEGVLYPQGYFILNNSLISLRQNPARRWALAILSNP